MVEKVRQWTGMSFTVLLRENGRLSSRNGRQFSSSVIRTNANSVIHFLHTLDCKIVYNINTFMINALHDFAPTDHGN